MGVFQQPALVSLTKAFELLDRRAEAMMRTRDFLSAFVIIFLVFGCSHKPQVKSEPRPIPAWSPAPSIKPDPPDPAKAALEEIQRQYRAEMQEMIFPRPEKEPGLGASVIKCKGFPKTLQAIGLYERKFGAKSSEMAPLTILKGMILLQSGRYRSASTIEPEMMKAATLLSERPECRADLLLARNFKWLVMGWGEIHKHDENLKSRNAGKVFPFANADFNKVHRAADRIQVNLLAHAARSPKMIRASESDLTGLYVAASAATFYAWVQRNNDRGCGSKNSEECTSQKRENKEKAVFYGKGKEVLELFLTESEKSSISHGRITKIGASPCRLRYLIWYEWLSQKIQEASSSGAKKGIASR